MSSDFQKLSQYLWVKQNSPYATNTGILIHRDQACLIDPGISFADCEEITGFVADHNATVTTILLTHAHWDHLLGAHYFPKARVVAHSHFLDIIHNHSKHLTQQVLEWQMSVNEETYEVWTPPIPSIFFTHGMDMYLGEMTIRLLHVPGHTADHTVVYITQEKILWAGDMLSDREIPLVEDIEAYINSLIILDEMEVNIVVPGHGKPATHSAEIQTRLDQDKDYVCALRQCVENVLLRGYDGMQAFNACVEVPFAQPDDYPNAHRWNIESAYCKLGGTSTSISGWDNEWLTVAK